MLDFLLWMLAGFVGIELLSYGLHRFLFHGPLWNFHQSHHRPARPSSKSRWELNDIFVVFFALPAAGLTIWGFYQFEHSWALALGTGISLYGGLYFIVHDVFTHGRFFRLPGPPGWIRVLQRAHRTHHQRVTKDGQEPYGLFFVPYWKYRAQDPKD